MSKYNTKNNFSGAKIVKSKDFGSSSRKDSSTTINDNSKRRKSKSTKHVTNLLGHEKKKSKKSSYKGEYRRQISNQNGKYSIYLISNLSIYANLLVNNQLYGAKNGILARIPIEEMNTDCPMNEEHVSRKMFDNIIDQYGRKLQSKFIFVGFVRSNAVMTRRIFRADDHFCIFINCSVENDYGKIMQHYVEFNQISLQFRRFEDHVNLYQESLKDITSGFCKKMLRFFHVRGTYTKYDLMYLYNINDATRKCYNGDYLRCCTFYSGSFCSFGSHREKQLVILENVRETMEILRQKIGCNVHFIGWKSKMAVDVNGNVYWRFTVGSIEQAIKIDQIKNIELENGKTLQVISYNDWRGYHKHKQESSNSSNNSNNARNMSLNLDRDCWSDNENEKDEKEKECKMKDTTTTTITKLSDISNYVFNDEKGRRRARFTMDVGPFDYRLFESSIKFIILCTILPQIAKLTKVNYKKNTMPSATITTKRYHHKCGHYVKLYFGDEKVYSYLKKNQQCLQFGNGSGIQLWNFEKINTDKKNGENPFLRKQESKLKINLQNYNNHRIRNKNKTDDDVEMYT